MKSSIKDTIGFMFATAVVTAVSAAVHTYVSHKVVDYIERRDAQKFSGYPKKESARRG
jgi:hydroxymethylglutaryl-CoA reductase